MIDTQEHAHSEWRVSRYGSGCLDRSMSRMVKVELRAAETKAEGCFCCLASQVHIEVSVSPDSCRVNFYALNQEE